MAVAMAVRLVWSVALAVGLVFSLSSTAILQSSPKGLAEKRCGAGKFCGVVDAGYRGDPDAGLDPLLAAGIAGRLA